MTSKSRNSFQEEEPLTNMGPTANKGLMYYQERLKGNLELESCSGIIKKVRLFNFMCHDRFEKDWNSNLNFITGENGSGKSAILSGIICGLGARANTTSRTKSISELVKTGTEFAKIEVTLSNHGILNEEKYGSEVIIQRIIDVRGPSTYKINTGLNSKFRPLLRQELDFILVSLGIMVDNPVAVLNQEAARSFLKTSNPADKYKFFFEGSSLSQFDRTLNEIKSNMSDTARNLEKSKEALEDRQDEVLKYKKLKGRLEEAERMEELIEKLTIEYLWSLVIADEVKRDVTKADLEKEETVRSKISAGLDSLIEKKKEMAEDSNTSPQEIADLKIKLRNLGKEGQDLQREMTQINGQANENKAKVRSSGGQISVLTKTLADIEFKIQDMSTRGKIEAENAKKEFEEKKVQLQQEKEEYEQEYETLRSEKQQFNHGTDSLRQQLTELLSKEKELKHRVVRFKEEAKNLENRNSKVNRYAAFGRQMEDLMTKIQANQHKFKVAPRGPLGACFTVKDEKWVTLIEMILNAQLFDFVVENNADQNLLNHLIKQTFQRGKSGMNDSISGGLGRRPAVICNKAAFIRVFHTANTKATTPNHPTILDMIEIENCDTAVLNTLIDSCLIERILLFESNKDACDLLKDRHSPAFPRNCEVGFTLQFYQIKPDPRYRMEAKNQHHRNTYLKCSSAAQLRHLKREILAAEKDLENLGPELEAKRREEAIVRQELNNQTEALRDVQQKLSDIKMRIMTHSKTSTKEPDISSFVEELHDTKAQLERHTKQKEASELALQTFRSSLDTLKQRKDELDKDIQAKQARIAELTDVIDNYKDKLEEFENKIRAAKIKLRDTQGRCDVIKPKLERLEKSVEEKTAEAEQKGERVDTERTPLALQDDVKEYGRLVNEAKKLVGDRQTILRDLARAKERFRQFKDEYACLLEVYRLMRTYVGRAIEYYVQLVQIIGNVLITSFQCLIASRGYKGKLLIDHQQKELYYFVCPDAKANEKTLAVINCINNKTVKHYLTEYANGLSGGERSFATICYILSMWQIMECPFFMLDEFDVFMDTFNRKASQNALVSHANRFKSHQFFLFTPLEITDLENNCDASVLKMFPPLRNDIGNNIGGSNDTENSDIEDNEDSGRSSAGKRRRLNNGKPGNRPQNEPVAGTSQQTNHHSRTRNRRR